MKLRRFGENREKRKTKETKRKSYDKIGWRTVSYHEVLRIKKYTRKQFNARLVKKEKKSFNGSVVYCYLLGCAYHCIGKIVFNKLCSRIHPESNPSRLPF